MGWLSSLLGINRAHPDRRKDLTTGFFWGVDGLPALRAGKGFTQDVVGESFYRATIEAIAGGQTKYGVMIDTPATLVASEWKGRPAVEVHVRGARVGSISSSDAAALHRELLALSPTGKASAKGRIQAGFEGGDYCVKLSLSRPLRQR